MLHSGKLTNACSTPQENPLELASTVAGSGEVDTLEETAGDADAEELDGELDGDAPDFDES